MVSSQGAGDSDSICKTEHGTGVGHPLPYPHRNPSSSYAKEEVKRLRTQVADLRGKLADLESRVSYRSILPTYRIPFRMPFSKSRSRSWTINWKTIRGRESDPTDLSYSVLSYPSRSYEAALNDRDAQIRKMREECQALMVELQMLLDTKQVIDNRDRLP